MNASGFCRLSKHRVPYNTIIFGGFGDGSTKDIMTIDGNLPTIEKIDNYKQNDLQKKSKSL